MGRQKVTVLMPMHNAERFVAIALRSILQERTVSLEVIVVDDDSSDGSRKEVSGVSDPRVRVLSGPCRGISAALNTGLAQAGGELVMRCDADDVYPAGRIAHQVQWLDQHPEQGAVCGAFVAMTAAGREIGCLNADLQPQEITEELRHGLTRTHLGTFAVRAEVLARLGGFREYFESAEDIDMQLRLGEQCRVFYLAERFYGYRLHSGSITHTQAGSRREFFEQVARAFQVERRSTGTDALEHGTAPVPPPRGTGAPRRSAEHVWELYTGVAWAQHAAGRRAQAIMSGTRALLTRPGELAAWRGLIALALKRPGPVE